MISSRELIDALVDIEIDNLVARIGRYPGTAIERFGSAVAFSSQIPVRLYNSVLGFSDEAVEHLDAIRAFYAARGIDEAIEIVPGRLSEATGRELARRGYAMVEFHGGYARSLEGVDAAPVLPDSIAITEIDRRDAAGLDRFIATHVAGWGGDPTDPRALDNMRRWRDNETWRFFLAEDVERGEPAGAAVLDIRGDRCLLAAGSTVEAARGRGVQAALIAARLEAGVAAGCRLAFAGSYFGNASMRNLQRAGFSQLFVRGIWVRR